MKKSAKTLLCCVLLIVCMVIQISAVPVSVEQQTRYANVNQLNCSLSFNGVNGSVSCSIIAKTGTTSIAGTLKLYHGFTLIESWDINVTSRYFSVIDSFTGTKGYTYRLVLSVDVTADGTVEPISYSTSKTCS